MQVRISRPLLDSIIATARGDPEHEICGVLLGIKGVISDIRPSSNVARDRYARFEIDPRVLLRAYLEARGGAHDVIGHYHSHPNGSSAPSPADAAEALDDDVLWLIIGADDVRIWRTASGGLHNRFHLQQLIVEP